MPLKLTSQLCSLKRKGKTQKTKDWGLNSGPPACQAGSLPHEPQWQAFLLWLPFKKDSLVFMRGVPGILPIWDHRYAPLLLVEGEGVVLANFLRRLAFRDPPDLHLWSSWDCRRESARGAHHRFFLVLLSHKRSHMIPKMFLDQNRTA
jgi:hypothetical protein